MKKKTVPILLEDESLFPLYGSDLASGSDVRSASTEEILIPPNESKLIPTGIRMQIPEGYEIQIRPRSGLALHSQVTVLNTPGTIDGDYRGEIKVILINHGKNVFSVTYGMRIAQIVLAEVIRAEFILEETLGVTTRGEGGFGHTGSH